MSSFLYSDSINLGWPRKCDQHSHIGSNLCRAPAWGLTLSSLCLQNHNKAIFEFVFCKSNPVGQRTMCREQMGVHLALPFHLPGTDSLSPTLRSLVSQFNHTSFPLSSSDHCCLTPTQLYGGSECKQRSHTQLGIPLRVAAAISALGSSCLNISLGHFWRGGAHLPHPKPKNVSALRLPSVSGHSSAKGWDGRLWKKRVASPPSARFKNFYLALGRAITSSLSTPIIWSTGSLIAFIIVELKVLFIS